MRVEGGDRPMVLPSILSADFARLGSHAGEAAAGGAGMLHVDVMDGRFVPNITIGLPVVASLRRATDLPLDVHLMIVEPERYVEAFRRAGADLISVHVEACPHLHHTLGLIRASGARAGVAVNPGTPLSFLPHVAALLDYVLVMTVNPGWGGQRFIDACLPKVVETRRILDASGAADVAIEVDGGVDEGNAARLVHAGARLLVCGSSVFGKPDPAAAVRGILAAAAAGDGGGGAGESRPAPGGAAA